MSKTKFRIFPSKPGPPPLLLISVKGNTVQPACKSMRGILGVILDILPHQLLIPIEGYGDVLIASQHSHLYSLIQCFPTFFIFFLHHSTQKIIFARFTRVTGQRCSRLEAAAHGDFGCPGPTLPLQGLKGSISWAHLLAIRDS